MIHELKTDLGVFEEVRLGLKRFEIRLDDRQFRAGDFLYLRQTHYSGLEMKNGAPLIYTGASVMVKVLHIMSGPVYGLCAGWVIMSIELACDECPACAEHRAKPSAATPA